MKHVTDEEFNIAYKDHNNTNIIHKVCSKYRKSLSIDILESCGMVGLWKCLGTHDHDKFPNRPFTSSLYVAVDWECKRELGKQVKKPLILMGEVNTEQYYHVDDMLELLEMLPDHQRQVVYQRFYEGCTLSEIGKIHGYSKEAARQNVNKGVARLRRFCEEFGV
jgi:RNA polymerase sigma factor (sigma-70 family)